MALKVKVISQQPPGGRCNLYAGYAEALARHFKVEAEIIFSETRSPHGEGFPSLWLNDTSIQPEDGAILMPSDIFATLTEQGTSPEAMMGLGEELEVPLERILGKSD